jgi:predicted HTH domain antitoxin
VGYVDCQNNKKKKVKNDKMNKTKELRRKLKVKKMKENTISLMIRIK